VARRKRLRRQTRLGAVAALPVAVLLAGCGAGMSAVPRNAPLGPPPPPPAARAAEASVTDKPTPSADPSASQPSAQAFSASPEDAFWVGTFRGKKIRVPRGHGANISFTFDDGPSPTFTPRVLALLEKNDVPAVFCLIGQQARTYPDLVRREVKGGHVLCDHSRDHDLYMNRRGQAYVTKEVTDGLEAIHAATPETLVSVYRQPGGTWSPLVVHAMHQSGLTPLRWNDDPRDWSRPGSRVIVHRVVGKLTPGAVVLMHDGGGNRTQTLEALAWLLKAVKAAGWVPVLAPQNKLSDKSAARPQ
jgi:peptidoglycan/xylan/chitin deacetylase (PgdA/CDA1 family)